MARIAVLQELHDERVPVSIGFDAGDASARNPFGVPTPITTYKQRFGLNSFRTIGLQLGFNY